MSRDANRLNLGYVPVPHEALDHMMAKILNWDMPGRYYSNPIYNFLDPCAGEGEALKYIITRMTQGAIRTPSDRFYGARVTSYGIEVHEDRIKEARKNLNRVMHADFFMSEVEHDTMSFAWLNPPYDYDAEFGNTEFHFLEETTPLLMKRTGVLALCIPRYKLKFSADHLARNYYNIKVMTFPKDLYEQYNQIILVAAKRRYPEARPFWVDKIANGVIKFAEGDGIVEKMVVDSDPYSPDTGALKTYDAEPTRITPRYGNARLLRFSKRDYNLREAIEATPRMFDNPVLLERIKPRNDIRLESVTNIRNSHIVQLIASGALNNTVMPDGTIIKGSSTKVVQHDKEYTDDSVIHTEVERSRTSIIELDTSDTNNWQYTEYTNYTDVTRDTEDD